MVGIRTLFFVLFLSVISACTGSKGITKDKAAGILTSSVKDIPINVTIPTKSSLPVGYAKLYEEKYSIIRTAPLRLGGRRLSGLDKPTIEKNGWKEHLNFVDGDITIANYYVSFDSVTDIVAETTEPGCNALAYYTVKISKRSPWTESYLEMFGDQHGAGEIDSFVACLENRDSGWHVKDAFWK